MIPKAPLVVIAGPTGSGKSSLAIEIARRFQGEVVNCDSVQVFRHFDIGAAKVAPQDWQGIPHHLVSFIDPDEVFTAGDYARIARAAIREIAGRGKLPVVAGGTGFYLRALLEGLFEGPARDDEVRRKLLHREALRPGSLHRLLRRLDPSSASRIHAHDTNKLTRALEVRLLTRRPLSEMLARGRDRLEGFRWLQIGLNPERKALYRVLEERVEEMFAMGLVEETRRILGMGFPPTAKPFESLGYAQALRVIAGTLTLDAAIADTKLQTRRYSKRQWTWFRRDRDVHWLDGFGNDATVRLRAAELVESFLAHPEKS